MKARKRKPLTRKQRFEIFKRDGFACLYCGRKAPEVELQVDHIVPVVAGGTKAAEGKDKPRTAGAS